ncbi:MAG: hypothetical protein MUC50_04155 [Myxococcota bacterium]|jgi:hypothetical protein|nr:hypothetical protein [Myxococcota bacterium]
MALHLFSEQTLIAAAATTNEHENATGAQRVCLAKAWSEASRVAAVGHFPRLFFRAKKFPSHDCAMTANAVKMAPRKNANHNEERT